MDIERFISSLAGELVSTEWTAPSLQKILRLPPSHVSERTLRVPGLIDRVSLAFPDRPTFAALSHFLLQDAGLRRAATRQEIGRNFGSRPAPPPRRLQETPLPQIATEFALAEWFGISVSHLQWLADLSGRNRRHSRGPLRTYRHRWIARRNGPPRLLEIPKARLKRLQRMLLAEILALVPLHDAVHGFRPGRSTVTNAGIHCGKACVLRFDLADFFPSVASARIFRIFRTLGYPPSVARLLTGLCTTSLPADVWNARPGARLGADFEARQRLMGRHLPQGAPTSPALANLAAHRLDRRLSGLAAALAAAYTRYADDLTFSGDERLTRSRRRVEALVGHIARQEGFALNFHKTRFMRAGVRQHVTSLVVNARPNIPRAEFDRLKAILTNCLRHGPQSQNRAHVADFRAHLTGKVAHIASVHPKRGAQLRRVLDQIQWPATNP